MNAIEYFKSYGLSEAKRILRDAHGCASVRLYGKYNFSTDDLKQIVDAFELVYLFGDNVSYAKKYLNESLLKFKEHMKFHVDDHCMSYSFIELRDAINLVEQLND